MYIGVCDAAARNAWAVYLCSGMLRRCQRDEQGRSVRSSIPPDGWPDGFNTQVFKRADGQPHGLLGATVNAVIEVLVDHDSGSLAYRVNHDERRHVFDLRFPAGAALRPFALLGDPGDRVLLGGTEALNQVRLVGCEVGMRRLAVCPVSVQ